MRNIDDQIRNLYFEAMEAYDNNDFDRAIDFLDKIFELNPTENNAFLMKASALFNKAKILFNKKEYEEAYYHFRESVSYNSRQMDSWHYMAIIKAFYSDYDSSLRFINKALEHSQHDLIFLNFKASLLKDMGNRYDSIELFKKIIEIDPEFKTPYLNLASIYIESNLYDLAINYLDEVLKLDPNASDVHFEKAKLLCKNKDKEKALESIERAIKIQRKKDYLDLKNLILDI